MVHRTFGLACVGTSILYSVASAYPKFELLFLLSGHFTAILFTAASSHFQVLAQLHKVSVENYVFILANVVAGWVALICLMVFLVKKCLFQHCTDDYRSLDDDISLSDLKSN
jgi:hypothetical protein